MAEIKATVKNYMKMLKLRSFYNKWARIALYTITIASVSYTFVQSYLSLPQISPSSNTEELARAASDATRALFFMGLGLFGTVLFFFLSFTWDLYLWLNKTSDSLGDAVDHFDNVVDCRYLGLGSQTLNQVLERLKTAQTVKNTFVLFGVAEKDAYVKDQFHELHKKINSFLKAGGSWTDIVSQDVVNSQTMSWLKFLSELHEEAKKVGNAGEKINAQQAQEAIERYRMSHLKGIYPLINFMILRSGDDIEEVIFGWGHHSEDPTGRVFLSRNKRLIATFDQYWKILEKDSVLVELQSRPITPAEITGLWFRVSYLVDHDWKARAGIPPEAKDDPHDIALVKISIQENRNLVIEGRRFKLVKDEAVAGRDKSTTQKKRITRIEGFKSNAADLELDRIWFATTSASDEKLHIAGWYRFIKDHQEEFGDIRIQTFRGEFAEYTPAGAPSSFTYKVGRLLLYGQKVPKSWLKNYSSDLQSEHPKELKTNNLKAEGFLDDFPNADKDKIDLIEAGLRWWNKEGKKNWQYGEINTEEELTQVDTHKQAKDDEVKEGDSL